MAEPTERTTSAGSSRLASLVVSLVMLFGFLAAWQVATRRPAFDPSGKTEDELMLMEFNGDIVRSEGGEYIFNPDKVVGFPGPLGLVAKIREELAEPFHERGTNDHGIGFLVWYTVQRFAIGYGAASIFAVFLGVVIGLSPLLFRAFNPFIQVLKPISPLAWMPLLLYSVQDPSWTAVLVVFMAALWPTVANTAFGVNTIRRDYLQVASMLELSWPRRMVSIVLPAAAPAIVAGLRISFGSALVAVVPAEMLLGELGVGYLTWIEWNNLDISGVMFAILVVGVVGTLMDGVLTRLSRAVTYAE